MTSPRPRDPDEPPDTFFVGPAPDSEPAPLDVRDPRNRHLFLLGPNDMDIDRLKQGASVDEPTVSASMATAALAYSGITVKMLVDKRLDAQLQTMFMVFYQPGAVAHPHDHPFEESYFMLDGEVEVSRGRGALHAPARRRLLDRRRLHPRVLRDEGQHRALARDVRSGPAGSALVSLRARLAAISRSTSGLRRRSGPATRFPAWKRRASIRPRSSRGIRRSASGCGRRARARA